jgi:hypothetical protein
LVDLANANFAYSKKSNRKQSESMKMKLQLIRNEPPTVNNQVGGGEEVRFPALKKGAVHFEITVPLRVPPIHQPSTELRSLKAELREQVHAVCRQVRKAFGEAEERAVGDRLDWDNQLTVLEAAYRAVWDWRRGGWAHTVAAMLRRMAPGRIWRKSGLALVVLRSALPDLCPKRASKWAAALDLAHHHEIDPARLGAFLAEQGGIDGAAKEWVEIRSEDWD